MVRDSEFDCAFLDATGNFVAQARGIRLQDPATLPALQDDERRALKAALDAEFNKQPTGARFDCNPGDTVTLERDSPAHPWHAVLSRLGVGPYPLPQWLKLAFQFRVDPGVALDKIKSAVAAPVLPKKGAEQFFPDEALAPGRIDPAQPANPLTDSAAGHGSGRLWQYLKSDSSAPVPPVSAEIALCRLDANEGVSSGGFLNLTTLDR